jgi:formylglycine-generating enzyme required for sulfatase activity
VRELGGIRFVYVPAGEFRMGSSDAEVQRAVELCRSYPDDGGGDCATKFEDERPTRTVYLDAFWVMQTELTNAHFAPFVNGGGYQDPQYWSADGWNWRQSEGITQPGYWNDARLNAPQQPVVGLSWFEAEAYTNWLRQQTGRPVRLPTEEEWEKAARGTDGRLFPWGNDWNGANTNFCDRACTLYAWADPNVDDGFAFTAPVGAYRSGASPYGVLDMAGNVWEWVANRARRGGSWTNDPEGVRTTERLYDDRYTRANVLEFPSKAGTGFRLVVSDDF